MARFSLYDQKNHIVVLDGVPLSAFAEGDFLELKQDGAPAVRCFGADGPTMNFCPPAGGHLVLGLSPTSPALDDLQDLWEAQLLATRLFTTVLLSGVNEIFTAYGCAFGETPSFLTGGATIQPRQYQIEFLKIEKELASGEIGGGFFGGLINL